MSEKFDYKFNGGSVSPGGSIHENDLKNLTLTPTGGGATPSVYNPLQGANLPVNTLFIRNGNSITPYNPFAGYDQTIELTGSENVFDFRGTMSTEDLVELYNNVEALLTNKHSVVLRWLSTDGETYLYPFAWGRGTYEFRTPPGQSGFTRCLLSIGGTVSIEDVSYQTGGRGYIKNLASIERSGFSGTSGSLENISIDENNSNTKLTITATVPKTADCTASEGLWIELPASALGYDECANFVVNIVINTNDSSWAGVTMPVHVRAGGTGCQAQKYVVNGVSVNAMYVKFPELARYAYYQVQVTADKYTVSEY